LQDVLLALTSAAPQTPSIRNMISSARKFCEVAGRQPFNMRLHSPELRAAFQTVNWGAFRFTRQRWANIRSDVKRAIRFAGLNDTVKQSKIPLSDKWEEIISPIKHPTQKSMLCRLGRFCSGLQISPDDVDDDTLNLFFQDLADIQCSKSPERITRDTIRCWNKHIATGDGARLLSSLSKRDCYSLPWDAFPISFFEDARSLHDRSLMATFLDEDIRQVRPATAEQRERQIRRLASAEVRGGVPISEIVDLRALVHPARLQKGMEFLLSRNDGKPNQQVYDFLILAQTIAKHWAKIDEVQIAEITKWAKKTKPNKSGMTARNRERMEPLKDPVVRERLYDLPKQLAAKALVGPPTYAKAMLLQSAVAIGILLNAPIRLQNLRTLEWDTHFAQRHTNDGKTLFLVLPAHEVKNDSDIELPLPKWLEPVFDRYINDYRPLIAKGSGSSFLIPGPTAKPKSDSGTRSHLMRTIKRELGLTINPHLFRHIAAFTFLTAYPGHYETVRKLLGHKNIQTTLNFYTGIEDEAAIAMFGAMVETIGKEET
tara:strand:- start:2697 stop:4322 length:1626 start_codon:yes stop_codon:yes gene_type:complete